MVENVRYWCSPAAAKTQVLVFAQVLIANDQNLMFIKVLTEKFQNFIGAIVGQVNSLNFYAEISIKPLS